MDDRPEILRLPLEEAADAFLEAGARTEADADAFEEAAGADAVEVAAADVPPGRAIALRMARLHLRAGALALARAELEAFAGRGVLDEEALADLAEARWRTGDLAGAGEAALYSVDRGRDELLTLVVAAEAMAAMDRPDEALALANRALEAAGGQLDAVFAGMSRSLIWPDAATAPDVPDVPDAPRLPATPVMGVTTVAPAAPAAFEPAAMVPVMAPVSIADEADADPGDAPDAPAPASLSAAARARRGAAQAAAEAYAGGRGALAHGDLATAAIRLAVSIRLEPAFAQAVLDEIGALPADPGLALVAGDALRILGREGEALEAFHSIRRHGHEG